MYILLKDDKKNKATLFRYAAKGKYISSYVPRYRSCPKRVNRGKGLIIIRVTLQDTDHVLRDLIGERG